MQLFRGANWLNSDPLLSRAKELFLEDGAAVFVCEVGAKDDHRPRAVALMVSNGVHARPEFLVPGYHESLTASLVEKLGLLGSADAYPPTHPPTPPTAPPTPTHNAQSNN